MERIRVAGIVKIDKGFALMHRKDVLKNDIHEYYTFPGGGLEKGETFEECAKREIKEEFGINVKVKELLYRLESKEFNQKEYFYLCEYIDGEFGTGDGPEFKFNPKYISSGKYLPEIIEEKIIEKILLLPTEIKEMFVKDIKNGKFK